MVKRYCSLCGCYLRYPTPMYYNESTLYFCDKCLDVVRLKIKVMDRKCKACGHSFLHPAGDFCSYCRGICAACGSSAFIAIPHGRECQKCATVVATRQQKFTRQCKLCEKDIASYMTFCNDCEKEVVNIKLRKSLRQKETDGKQRRIILD